MRTINYRGEWFNRPLFTGPWYLSYNEKMKFSDWQPMLFFSKQTITNRLTYNIKKKTEIIQSVHHVYISFAVWRLSFSFHFSFTEKPK